MPDAQERDQAIMRERINGRTLRQIAADHDLSVEGARLVSNRAAHQHVGSLVAHMWAAQAEGRLLMLAIPDASEPDQALAIRYLDWLLGQMDGICEVKVHYRPTPEGHVCFFLEDQNFTPNSTSQEVAQ
jgi:hypothetical protein